MCRSGYHIGCDGKCTLGWDPIELASLPGNTSALEVGAAEELDRQEDLEIMANVGLLVMWVASLAALVLGGTVFLLRRKLCGRDSEQAEYKEKLLAA